MDDTDDDSYESPTTVGSAALPLQFDGETERRALRLPSLLLHPLKATAPEDSHFEPESDDYLAALIAEDRRRARRRRITWLVFVLLTIGAIIFGLVLGYQFTQRHYFVGVEDGRVAIFQGVQQDIGPIQLSHVYEETTIEVADLPSYYQMQVEQSVNAEDLADARRIVEQLANAR